MLNLPTGRKVVISAFGEDPMDAITHNLSVQPQPPPDVSRLKPTDVVIAVKSAAVGWVDLLMSSGQYQHMPSPPYVPGLEYSGEVVWAGDAVTRVEVGARVLADGLLTGPRSWGDYQAYGGFATYAVAPQEAALPLPARISDDAASHMLGSYETAYHALVACGRLRAGEWALILGASGATGLAAVHLARLLGARVIVAGRSPEKLAALRAHGADYTVCLQDEAPLREQVKALTGGEGASVIYDPVGGDLTGESMRCAAFGARLLIVGWASTPFVAHGKGKRGAPNVNLLPTNLIMMKGLQVLGCPAVISTYHDPTLRPARLKQLWAWVEAGQLTPCVSMTFGMSEVVEALRAKWRNAALGAIVLHPDR
jgi:NADPH2:quinone reductase